MKPLGLALLAIGVVLLVIGFNSSQSFTSDVSRFFTGSPTDKTVWMLIGGVGSLVMGSFLTFFK